MKKKEILLIGSILAAALLLWAGMSISKKPQNNIRITVDGKEYGVYSLSENQTISINDTNVCPSLEVNTIFFRRSNYIKHLTNALKQGFFYFPKYLQNYFLRVIIMALVALYQK